jgi:signal transduction histidine kinase
MKADEVLAALREDLVKSCDQLSELSQEVHPFLLGYSGLAQGLRSLCRSISEAHGIVAEVSADEVPNLSPELSLCFFRVAQEALNNTVRHGQAKHVLVRVRHDPGGTIQLEVWDDGIGFDAGAPSSGLGLVSMGERLRMVHGTLTVTSTPGQGTVVIAAIRIGQSIG